MSEAVPVDLGGWFDGDDAARDQIAAEVDDACARTGFLAVTGHGVPAGLIEDMLESDYGIEKYFSYVVIKSPFIKHHFPIQNLFGEQR